MNSNLDFLVLMKKARDHMEENNYTYTSVTCYMRTWRSVYCFGLSKGITHYSAALAEQYMLERYHVSIGENEINHEALSPYKLSEDVYAIKMKKTPKNVMTYLSADAMSNLLSQPDSSTNDGLRDLTLLAFTYDTGARVSEVTELKFKDIRFEAPPIVKITGKGNKTRIVPLMPQTVRYLNEYVRRFGINIAESKEQYVFTNRSGNKLSRSGIKYILDKYVAAGREDNPAIFPDKISPHTLRHTKAMHMLQAGNNIVYIRDILGHSDLDTTERYARADTAMKREALAKAEIPMPEPQSPMPQASPDVTRCSIEEDMANWLKNFSK